MKDVLNNHASTLFSCLDGKKNGTEICAVDSKLREIRYICRGFFFILHSKQDKRSHHSITEIQNSIWLLKIWTNRNVCSGGQDETPHVCIWIWMCINQRDMIEQICGRRQVRTAQKKCHLLPWIKSLVFWQEQMRRLSGPIKSPEPKATQTTLPQEK